ncbi:MAG: hypothetical protein KAG66_08070, partial [Methylococcales bacterium]|nr:hypothetical protein [Methylococcales bacterium]
FPKLLYSSRNIEILLTILQYVCESKDIKGLPKWQIIRLKEIIMTAPNFECLPTFRQTHTIIGK